ncbi:hypothetical protein D3C85_1560020 [compost metagenome]
MLLIGGDLFVVKQQPFDLRSDKRRVDISLAGGQLRIHLPDQVRQDAAELTVDMLEMLIDGFVVFGQRPRLE